MDALLDHAPCGFLIMTDRGSILAANNTLLDMLGWENAALTGCRFDELLTVAGKIFTQTHFFPILRLQQKADEIFLTLKGRDGREVPALLNAKRLTVGETPEIHCTIMPVYQRRKFEAELIAARKAADDALNRNETLQKTALELEASKHELDRQITQLSALHKEMSEFGHVISHDMQEPVRKILLFADLLHPEKGLPAEESIKVLDKIRTSGLRMRKLVAGLEEYMGLGFLGREPVACDLAEIIEAARLKALQDVHEDDLTLQVAPMPRIEGNPEQLSLLFYHLIRNALQFKEAAEKTVRVQIDADIIQQNSYRPGSGKYRYIDYVRIVFTDQGIGFENTYNEYVFQLFRKAHDGTPGLGVGLALCKKIVENHYGSVTARSQEGEGASFVILLPVKQTETA